MTDRILVLDADLPPALSVARSLKEIGLTVDVASCQPNPIAGYSRTVSARLSYPDPLAAPTAFIDWMRDITARDDYALIVPVTERTIAPLLKFRDRYDDRRVAMAPSDSLRLALDKAQTVAIAESVDIPVPRSITVDNMAQLEAARDALGFPIVIKPVSSVGADQAKNVQLTVSYAFDDNELRALVQHALRFGDVILQEYFRGEGEGIELLADHGEVVYAFQHRRLHEVPLTGGGSSLRMSVDITPALLDAARRLMAAMKWHGVAMVEFKHDSASGEFRLMEVNGRFWGSLPLAAAAGANFPAMLYELLVKGRIGHHAPARPNVYCRNLQRDVSWHEQVARKQAPPRLVSIPGWGSVLKDALLMLHWRHAFDVQRLSDPKPGLVDLGRIFKTYYDRVRHIRADRQALATQYRAWQNGSQRDIVGNAKCVLFVCYGNINRSAVAEAYARKRYADRIDVASAGIHQQEGRPADPTMVEVARKEALDLSDARSRHMSAEMIARADVILAMEMSHIEHVAKQFPEAKGKTFLLGNATATRWQDIEIADPYGLNASVYAGICKRVMASVDAWFGAETRLAE